MTAVKRYLKAASAAEALAARRAEPSAAYLAGGTYLLAGDGKAKPVSVIDIGAAIPRSLGREDSGLDEVLAIGAGATFREIAESGETRPCIAEAALSMANRNTRNRATLGGNLGADKSCSSLVPILIALGAEVEIASPSSPEPRKIEIEAWLRSRAERPELERASDLVLRVLVPIKEGRRAAYRRWNRASCDLSVLGAAVAYEIESGMVHGLRIALGGLGPKARRFPLLEALFEGLPLPSREAIEIAAAPLLRPIDDLRASAGFKRMRGAQLLADALKEATP
jgi:CO/xanthine dehydrogenase FAD-binding subunit